MIEKLKAAYGYVSAILFLFLGALVAILFARARKAETENERLMSEALLKKDKEDLEKQKEKAHDEEDAYERLRDEYLSKHNGGGTE